MEAMSMSDAIKESPKVSIIVPAYNSARWIARCIESIKAQSLCDFECICVDDGSTDGTGEILDNVTSGDKRFIVIHKINAGVSQARNDGLARARGKFLYFIDSDDIIHPDLLACCVNLLECNAADLVFFDYASVLEPEVAKWAWEDILASKVEVFSSPVSFCIKKCGIGRCGVVHMMFRHEIWGGLRFDSHLNHGEDLLAFYMFLRDCRRGVWLHAAPYLYVQHETSLTHSSTIKTPERNRIRLMTCLARHYERHPRLMRKLRRQLLASLIRKPLKGCFSLYGSVPKSFAVLVGLAFRKRLVHWMDFRPIWQFRIFMMLVFGWYISEGGGK